MATDFFDCKLRRSSENEFGTVRAWCVEEGWILGLLRPYVGGNRIGPLMADTPKQASELLAKLLRCDESKALVLDILSNNPLSSLMVEAAGFQRVPKHDNYLMFRGKVLESL